MFPNTSIQSLNQNVVKSSIVACDCFSTDTLVTGKFYEMVIHGFPPNRERYLSFMTGETENSD